MFSVHLLLFFTVLLFCGCLIVGAPTQDSDAKNLIATAVLEDLDESLRHSGLPPMTDDAIASPVVMTNQHLFPSNAQPDLQSKPRWLNLLEFKDSVKSHISSALPEERRLLKRTVDPISRVRGFGSTSPGFWSNSLGRYDDQLVFTFESLYPAIARSLRGNS